MSRKLNRREFVQRTAAALAVTSAAPAAAQSPAVIASKSAKPTVVSSANGNRFKNGGAQTCVEKAFSMIAGGSDVLDALIAGVNIVELDPEDDSVGYGGLPNADGVVQLDSCCMHGPKKRAGGVASLEGVRTPSLVAQGGDGADRPSPARRQGRAGVRARHGVQDRGRSQHREVAPAVARMEAPHRSRSTTSIRRPRRGRATDAGARRWSREGLIDAEHFWGTINCNGISAKGEICGVTTTSGLAWKIPGRVGDSPILGAGLYVDGEVGAAGSTGRGEANLFNLCSFLIVEEMRRGAHPKDAGMAALKRVAKNTVEKRLLNSRGQPNFGLNFYIVNAKGEHAGRVDVRRRNTPSAPRTGRRRWRRSRSSRASQPTD